jgi:hypothetical protein
VLDQVAVEIEVAKVENPLRREKARSDVDMRESAALPIG